MALIQCPECEQNISDKADNCIHCGFPLSKLNTPEPPKKASYNHYADQFTATRRQINSLAAKAVQELGWKVDSAADDGNVVGFTTGVSWGSWSGVSGSVFFEEIEPNMFKVSATAKQNVKGAQLIAFNIGNEAQKRADKVIDTMKRIAR